MHLAPRDIDKLALHAAGFLAQKRLARGVRLNYPESVALLATQILELIRDGRSVAELMDIGRRMLGRAQVMEGVADLLTEVQVEGTFPDGTKLVTVHAPIAQEQGDLALALYGSFLPVPAAALFADVASSQAGSHAPRASGVVPGELFIQPGTLVLNEGRDALPLPVKNVGDRPIQVGSHFPFWLTNAALIFDRAAAEGRRLDIPAGTAVRFEPGDEKTIQLIVLAATPEALPAPQPPSPAPGAAGGGSP